MMATAVPVVAKPPVETCRIVGPRASLTVAVTAGTEELSVMVRGARVTVVPRDQGASAVAVTGAIEFDGRAEELELFPSTPVLVANGVVQLGPMSVLQKTSPRGAEVVARTVDIGASFQIGEVSVPCSVVSFVGSGDPSEEAHRGARPSRLRSYECPDPCTYYTTPDTLDFHVSPGDSDTVRLTGSTVVFALQRHGTWTRVATADHVHMDGAQLAGWVEHSRLTRIEGGVGFTGGRGFAEPLGRGTGGTRVSGPGVFQGPAHVDSGTPVFALPTGGDRWATIRDGEAELEVVIWPGRDRARVLRAPFIPHLASAWVQVAAVHVLHASP